MEEILLGSAAGLPGFEIVAPRGLSAARGKRVQQALHPQDGTF
jgi:hypothetical protein